MKFFFLLFNEKKKPNNQLSPVIATFSTYHLQDPTLFWKNEQTANKDLSAPLLMARLVLISN